MILSGANHNSRILEEMSPCSKNHGSEVACVIIIKMSFSNSCKIEVLLIFLATFAILVQR